MRMLAYSLTGLVFAATAAHAQPAADPATAPESPETTSEVDAATLEGKVAELQDEKRELALSLFGDEESFSAKFTREDLERLLE